MIFVAVFKDTSLFNAKAFAISLVVATVVWMAAQARAHMKAKIFYVIPTPRSEKPEKTGRVVRSRGKIKAHARSPAIVRCQLRHRGRGHLS